MAKEFEDYIKTIFAKKPKTYNPSCGNERLNPRQDFGRHCNLDGQSSVFYERRKMVSAYRILFSELTTRK